MKVLLSQQDDQSAKLLQGELQAWGQNWQVETATSAEQFLALAVTGDYQAVIYDLSAEGAAGLPGVRQIRAGAPYAALLVTGCVDSPTAEAEILAEGADVYLVRRPGWPRDLAAELVRVEALRRHPDERTEPEHAVEQLREQHEAALASDPRPVLVLTSTGRIAACNQALADLAGYPGSHLTGRSFASLLLSPACLDQLLSVVREPQQATSALCPGLLSAWREGEDVAAELLIARTQGPYHLCRVRLRRLGDSLEKGVLVIVEEDHQGGVECGEEVGKGLAEAVWDRADVYAVQTDAEGRIVRLGRGWRAARGDRVEHLIGSEVADLLGSQVVDEVRQALRSTDRFHGEVVLEVGESRTESCHLTVTKVGPGATAHCLWLATTWDGRLMRDLTGVMEHGLVGLAEAIGCLEDIQSPEELATKILAAAGRLLPHDAGICRLDLGGDSGGHEVLQSSTGLIPGGAESVGERLGRLLQSGGLPPESIVFPDLNEYCRRGSEVSLQLALAAEGLTSAIWVPIRVGGVPAGFVFLGSWRKGSFSPWLQPMLDMLSAEIGRVAAAVSLSSRAQLATNLAQQLLRISVALNSRDNLAEVLRRVAEAAASIGGGSYCWVEALSERADRFENTFQHCPDEEIARELYAEISRTAWHAVETQAPTQAQVKVASGSRYWIVAVPLRAEGQVVGAMTLGHPRERRFDAAVVSALQVLATQAATAVRSTQLLALAAERTRRMEAAAVQAREEETRSRTVLQAAASVTESRDLRETIIQIARSAAQEIGFERVRVFLADHQTRALHGRAEAYGDGSVLNIDSQTIPLRAGADLLADAALGSAPYLMCSASAESQGGSSGYEQLIMPLRWHDELIGIIAADNRSSRRGISTQQTRLLRALATLAAVAIERGRMDELRHQLVSTVSHELRRPLSSIQAYGELLLDEDAGPINEEQRVYLERVQESCARLEGMIEDLLAWSKLRAGRITVDRHPSDVWRVIRDVAEELAPQARQAEVNLSLHTTGDLPPVDTDTSLLEQVLSNLVENAIKYNRPGGQVTVSVRSSPEGAVIEVSDTGPGIPPEFRGRIFEEFERGPRELHGRTEGTGLGLSIAARLTEYLGGSLQLDSTVGEGSTFAVRLPYARS